MNVRCMNCHKQTAFLVEITAPEGGNLQIFRCQSCHHFTWVKEGSEGPLSGSPESTETKAARAANNALEHVKTPSCVPYSNPSASTAEADSASYGGP